MKVVYDTHYAFLLGVQNKPESTLKNSWKMKLEEMFRGQMFSLVVKMPTSEHRSIGASGFDS